MGSQRCPFVATRSFYPPRLAGGDRHTISDRGAERERFPLRRISTTEARACPVLRRSPRSDAEATFAPSDAIDLCGALAVHSALRRAGSPSCGACQRGLGATTGASG